MGQVFLFHAPPGQEDIDVTAPLFGELQEAPDEFIVHIEDQDSSASVASRIIELSARVGLSPDELRRFSSLSIDAIERIRNATQEILSDRVGLRWNGYPTYDQIGLLMSIICSVRSAREFGCKTDKQLTLYINQLRGAATMRRFFLWHSSSFKGDVTGLDNVFKFLRAGEHSLPEFISLIQTYASRVFPDVDYSYLLGGLPNWFRPEELKILEEQGVPIQISERFLRDGDTVKNLGERLKSYAKLRDPRLSPFEREWILDALPG